VTKFAAASGPARTCRWSTPQDVFDALNLEFRFTLDVCAEADNAKCSAFYAFGGLQTMLV